MRPVYLRLVLLFFVSTFSTSCEKSDSPVDVALTQGMTKMHSAMHDVFFVGKPDADFALMMIPHHQGAIEMAKVELQPLVVFATNPAGAAIVDTLGPLRHFVSGPPDQSDRRYLVIVPAAASAESKPIQIQLD